MHGLHAAAEAVSVVQVDGDGDAGLLCRDPAQRGEVVQVGILDGARGGLHDDRRPAVLGRANDRHDELEVLHVECADRVVSGLCVQEHFLGGGKHVALLLVCVRRSSGFSGTFGSPGLWVAGPWACVWPHCRDGLGGPWHTFPSSFVDWPGK